jgi:hypothetical protein
MPDDLHARLTAALEARLEVARATSRWWVDFVCCGRADGQADFDSWDEADSAREAYCTGPGVDPRGCSGDGRSGHQRAAKLRSTAATEIRRVEALLRVVGDYDRALTRCKEHPEDMASKGALLALHGVMRDLAAGEGIEVGE